MGCFADLDEGVTRNIFLRLLVKDLIRLTGVSKSWNSIICDPNFISAQISRSVAKCNDDNSVLVIPCLNQKDFKIPVSLISANTTETFDIPFDTTSATLKLISQIDGMLCLTDSQWDFAYQDLYLWNPYARSHRKLEFESSSYFHDVYQKPHITVVGMGKKNNFYKIVRIFYVKDDKGNAYGQVAPIVEIYSSITKSWMSISTPVPLFANTDGVFVNSKFYWLEYGIHNFNQLRMLFFDFDHEVFGLHNLPHELPSHLPCPYDNHKLMKFEGSLALCVVQTDLFYEGEATNAPCSIWLMVHENGVVHWYMRFSTVLEKGGSPLNITNDGTLIMESCSDSPSIVFTSLFSCNLLTGTLQDIGFGNPGIPRGVVDRCTVDTNYPQSLVLYNDGE